MIESTGRRSLLRGLFAAAAVANGVTGTAPAAAASMRSGGRSLNAENANDVAMIFRKLAYSTDGALGYWHLTATRHGLVGSELIPFWQMNIGRFFTVQDLPGGHYSVTQMGIAFYTDLASGELLRRFVNPVTHDTVDIPYGRPTPNRYAPPVVGKPEYEPLAAAVSRDPNTETRTRELIPTGSLGPAWIQGDHVWVQQDHLLTLPAADPSTGASRISDLTTYFGSLRDVADPSVTMPAAGHAFTDINDWPPWLGMGNRPGVYYSRGVGFKAFAYDGMPSIWRRLMQQEYPGIARDPRQALLG